MYVDETWVPVGIKADTAVDSGEHLQDFEITVILPTIISQSLMRDELYIDGTKVDMGESGVSLEYRSNILTDISKIVSNFSYTIKAAEDKE